MKVEMTSLPFLQPSLEAQSAKRQRDDDVEKASRICEELTHLMDETLVSLFYCYKEEPNIKRCGFPASVSQESKNPKSAINPRDTAIVLTAMKTAGQEIMDLTPTRHTVKFSKEKISQKRQKFIDRLQMRQSLSGEPIQYNDFLNLFFVPCLENILEGRNNPFANLRGSGTERETAEAKIRSSRDPFSLARILGLLNLHTREETHGKLYVDAVAEVVGALCETSGPNYAFGGASLTNAEPHAFVSYYCLSSLTGVREIMEKRAREHKELALLLVELAECKDQDSATCLMYGGWQGLKQRLPLEIDRLKHGVGISAIVKAVEKYLDKETLSNEIRRKIKQSLNKKKGWVAKFQAAIQREIQHARVSAKVNLKKLAKPTHNDGRFAGRTSMKTAEFHMKGAAQRWKLAFFEGMEDVLSQIRKSYSALGPGTNLKKIAEAVREVGEIWEQRAARTKIYISKFTKWATGELQRQLSFSHIRFQTNFDPVQLAFLLRIDNDLSPGKNLQLTLKGLEILFDSQQRDGMWPVGAPLFFEPQIGRAIYVANLEIVNAILPLVKEHDKIDLYWENLERVLNWLRTNRKEVQLEPSADNSRVKKLSIRGWATEKVPEQGRIDVWLTALALEFLHAYRDVLMEFVNRGTVHRKYDRQIAKDLLEWQSLVDPQLSRPYPDRISTKIYTEYILPFREVGTSRKNAMILYGPPGTGKTSIADAIARELDWALVTITPSDFVKEGIEKSEYMARALFNDLLKLRYTVVLFDEIDEMLKSRSQKADKGDQGGVAMLQFIVPGMLPKLQRLKKYGERHGVIIIIATNYFERLDSAVKRRGRIDDYFAIYPPDQKSRQFFIYKSLSKVLPPESAGQTAARARAEKREYMEFAKDISHFTQGWAFIELDRLVRFFVKNQKLGASRGWELFLARWKSERWKKKNVRAVRADNKPDVFANGYYFIEPEEKRSLNPTKVYEDRSDAVLEFKEVSSICQV